MSNELKTAAMAIPLLIQWLCLAINVVGGVITSDIFGAFFVSMLPTTALAIIVLYASPKSFWMHIVTGAFISCNLAGFAFWTTLTANTLLYRQGLGPADVAYMFWFAILPLSLVVGLALGAVAGGLRLWLNRHQ